MGEPLHLHCAIGRRCGCSIRLLDKRDSGHLGESAETRSGASQRSGCPAIRHNGGFDDAHLYCRECVLLSRSTALRAPRSQYPVLEVAAGIRSHYSAREGEHSPRRSAASNLCDHSRHAVDYAAVEQLNTIGERSERGGAVDEIVVLPDVHAAALSSFDGPCALAFASLLLAASGIGMGATRDISMGCIAAGRHWRR